MRYFILIVIIFELFSLKGQGLSEEINWYFIYDASGDTLHLGKKGSVQHSLWKSGLLPDPFIDSNDLLYLKLEEQVFTLKSNFIGDPYLDFEHVELILDQVDTYAEVLVNGDPLLLTENAFRSYKIDITDALVSGQNEIELRMTPAVMYHRESYLSEAYHLPAPNDNHKISVASRVRKPQFQFGWDWVPRMNTIGINGGVKIKAYNERNFGRPKVFTELINDSIGVLRYIMEVGGQDAEYSVKTKYSQQQVKVTNGELVWFDSIIHPELWHPIGLGDQLKHHDFVNVYNSDNQLLNSFEIMYGFRSVELIQEKDRWGESYYFMINGDRIFGKGANYIPASVFLHEITQEKEIALVAEMAKSNFNMIRVWGGGAYASESFLNACDSLGILVWHDLMFACAMYPGDDTFINNVQAELEQQLARILSHPCIVQINGNNEVDVAWKNWGIQESYSLDTKAQNEISESYKKLFQELVPSVLSSYNGIPYTHTSPLSNWGKLTDFDRGSQHYWGLWHGNDELVDAKRKVGRFNSEYGFQSFPELELLKYYSTSDLTNINDPLLIYRQQSYVGNKKILEKVVPMYGEVKSLEDFIYKSQIYQAEALETYIFEHRKNAKRCGGTLFWQFNDVYPGPTWSVIDYFGNYKAAYFAAKRSFEDVLVHWEDDSLYISNISSKDCAFQVNFKWLDFNGKIREEGVAAVSSGAFETSSVPLFPLKRRNQKKDLVLQLEYSNKVPELSKKTLVRKSKAGVIEGDIEIVEVVLDTGSKGLLIIDVKEFNELTWILCDESGVKMEQNFLNLLPGIHKIPFRYSNEVEVKDFRIYRN